MFRLRISLLAALVALPFYARSQSHASSDRPWMNPSTPLEDRINSLISQMTLEEKVQQMRDHAPAIPRLGVPAYYWWNEGLTASPSPARHQLPAGHRHGRHLGHAARPPRWPRPSPPKPAPNTTRPSATTSTSSSSASPSGRPTSTSFAIRAGAAARRPTAKIPSSPAAWPSPSSPACRATTPTTSASSPRPSTTPCTAAPNPRATRPTSTSPRTTSKTPTSPPSAPPSPRPTRSPSCAPTTPSTARPPAPTPCSCAITSATPGTSTATSSATAPPSPTSTPATTTRPTWPTPPPTPSKPAPISNAASANGQAFPALVEAVHQQPHHRSRSRHRTPPPLPRPLPPRHVRPALKLRLRPHSLHRSQLARAPPAFPPGRARIHGAAQELRPHSSAQVQSVRSIAVIGPTAELIQSLQGNYNGPPPSPVYPLDGIEKRFASASIHYAQGSTLVDGFAIPIEHTALHPAHGSGDGLTGEYFSSADLSGTPVAHPHRPQHQFQLGQGRLPSPACQRNNYSVRWTGTFTPPAPGDYKLGVRVNYCYACENAEGFRLYLDGKLIVSRTPAKPA